MIQLLEIYKWNILCGFISASALAWLGCFLATREKSLQSLVISQGATFGVLFFSGIVGFFHTPILQNLHFLPLLGGLLLAILTYILSERIANLQQASITSSFIAMFAVLLAANYWIISYFPNLEGHMSQAFFGDLVTMNGLELWIALVISSFASVLLIIYRKSFIRDSFDIATFGIEFIGITGVIDKKQSYLIFNLLTVAVLTVSIFSLGFLFTIATLFIPTVIFSFLKKSHATKHFCLSLTTAGISTSCGFLMSLYWDWLPTVPTIVLCMTGLGLLFYWVNGIVPRRS